jgi:hypothetical protein
MSMMEPSSEDSRLNVVILVKRSLDSSFELGNHSKPARSAGW